MGLVPNPVRRGQLSGEFSKRTVNCISSITRKEALEFESFCRFCVNFADQVVPFIITLSDPVFSKYGIDFGLLLRLEEDWFDKTAGQAVCSQRLAARVSSDVRGFGIAGQGSGPESGA